VSRHTGEFIATYHMTEASSNKLADLLAQHLQVDAVKSRNCTAGIQPIDKRKIVAAGLRWLGGESHKSLAEIFHLSRSSAKRVVGRFIDAVIVNLQIGLPTTDIKLEAIATGWTQKSSAEHFATMDSFLHWMAICQSEQCQINLSTPTSHFFQWVQKDTGPQRSSCR
jgi:hypothetical protein